MAVSFIAGATNTTAGALSLSVDVSGLTILENDVLIAILHVNNTPGVTSDSSLFTEKFGEENPTISTSYHTFWERVAGASEGSSYTWSFGSSQRANALVLQFRGVDTTTIWDVAPSATTRSTDDSATTASSPPSLTTTNADTMGIGAAFSDSSGPLFSSWTNSYINEVEHGSGQAVAAVSKAYTTSGSKGTVNATCDTLGDIVIHHVALKGAAGAAITVTVPTGPVR